MIQLNDALYVPNGELYILPSKNPTESYHCYYSFDPANTFFPMSFQKETFCIDTPNFQGLLRFLNYNDANLANALSRLEGSILSKNEISSAVKNFKNELIKLSPFFQFHTEYYIYDILMQAFFHICSDDLRELDKTRLEDFQNTTFSKLLLQLFKYVFKHYFDNTRIDTSREVFDNLKRYYHQELTEIINTPESYMNWSKSNIMDDIWNLKTFILNEMPDKSIDFEDENWQLFLFSLSKQFETVHTLSPYTLTNHAKIENINEYKKLLQNNPNIFMDIATENIPPSKDCTNIFKQSKKELKTTYPISSIEQYVIAEIKELLNQGCTIKFCTKCGQYYAYRKDILTHNCIVENILQENSNAIQKLYYDVLRKHNVRFNSQFANNYDDKQIQDNMSYYWELWDIFSAYHKKNFHTALINHLNFHTYECFLNQDEYCFNTLKKAHDKLNLQNDIYSQMILLPKDTARLIALHYRSAHKQYLENPLPDIYSYIKFLSRHGYID